MKNRLLVKSCIEQFSHDMETVSRLFYKELFHLDLQLKTVFPGNVVFLNRKFANMMATFKNVKHLENIRDSVVQMGKRHALQYHAEIKHFPLMKEALLKALAEYLGAGYNENLETAWVKVFDEVAAVMQEAMADLDMPEESFEHKATDYDAELLNKIGGEAVVTRVHQRFYNVMFDEPWLEKFFFGKSKEALIKKQTQFMVAAFNGPNHYTGDTPAFVHMHMFITDEMADIREQILKASILEEGLSEEIARKWLAVDRSFRPAIVKKSLDECVMKCKGQVPVTAQKPLGYGFKLQKIQAQWQAEKSSHN